MLRAAASTTRTPSLIKFQYAWLPTTASGSGRVPLDVRPGVHPDFLSSSLALTKFIRLSLMKAAHASVGGAPCRKSGTMGRKRILQTLSLHVQFLYERRDGGTML
jgi:hypothetical protein